MTTTPIPQSAPTAEAFAENYIVGVTDMVMDLCRSADEFRMLFVVDGDPPSLSTHDIYPNLLAQRFDRLSKKIAETRAALQRPALSGDSWHQIAVEKEQEIIRQGNIIGELRAPIAQPPSAPTAEEGRMLDAELIEFDVAAGAVAAMRRWADEGLGFNCTFVDDDMKVVVGLAQRAVLSGLASDFSPDMQKRFTVAAEKHRASHEKSLGRTLTMATK